MTRTATHRTTSALVVLVLVTGSLGPASADDKKRRHDRRKQPEAAPAPAPTPAPAPEPEPPTGPWADGVSDAQKAAAQRLLEAGNALLLDKKYAEALIQYQAALEQWDHPAIRFNVVRCLINLGRPLDAFASLELALRYGAAPLEDAVYQEALGYQRLLEGQIGAVEVSCQEPGATVTLDGQALMTCPGAETRRVLIGRHQLVARKRDFLTVTRDLDLTAGKTEAVALTLVSLADSARTERRWSTWKPWAVVGAGAVVAGVGGLVQLAAVSNMDQYDDEVATLCGTSGCPPTGDGALPASTRALEDRARFENKLALSLLVTGGALAIGGLVGVYLNRPRTVLPDTEAGVIAAPATALAPLLGPDLVGLSFDATF